jgi:ketosteroid isomerase-like protein
VNSERSESRGDAKKEIEERIAGYLEQLTETRDIDAAEDYFTADVRFLGPGMDLSRAAILEGIRGVFDTGVEVQVNRRTLELFVHGDTAYEIAQAEDTFVNPDGTSNTLRNNMFIRWERGLDTNWRFARALLSPQDTR